MDNNNLNANILCFLALLTNIECIEELFMLKYYYDVLSRRIMKSQKKYRNQFLIFFVPLLLTEISFRLLTEMWTAPFFWIRSIIYITFISGILTLLNTGFRNLFVKIISTVALIGIPVYAFFQQGINYYYGHFFSARFLRHQTPDVGSYTVDYLTYIRPISYLILLIGIVAVIKYWSKKDWIKVSDLKKLSLSLVSILGIFVMYLVSLFIFEPASLFEKSINLFKNPEYSEIAMNQIGMTSYLFSDVATTLVQPSQEIELPSEIEEPTVEQPKPSMEREYDDFAWKQAKSQETDEIIKTIDEFFLSKSITPKNEMTGEFEGKNLIYMLVEAFDMIAIDETLTPTLFKLKEEGIYFDSFYSPQFNCATAESELISMTSIYPVVDICTMNSFYESASPQSVFNLFKDKGYSTSSFHNWNDQFYPRTLIHPVLGSDKYLDSDTLIPNLINGWQSDLTMMEEITEILNNEESKKPFMSYILTSTTHLPYDIPSALGDKYLGDVGAVYPQAPIEIQRYLSKAIELDKAMEHLINNLEDIENTVIVMFADHRPLKMDIEFIDDHAGQDRITKHESDRTPMIIYTPGGEHSIIDTPSSTIDLMPTIANLFNLDYDTRLFMGEDIFSEHKKRVIFANGSWYDEKGYYDSFTGEFFAEVEGETYSEEALSAINDYVRTEMKLPQLIYINDYFRIRENVLN